MTGKTYGRSADPVDQISDDFAKLAKYLPTPLKHKTDLLD